MSTGAVVGIALGALAVGLAAGWLLPPHGRAPARTRPRPVRNILLPFAGTSISRRALEAAVRLSKAENAVIMPAFLARVPNYLPLDAPLPDACLQGMPLLEAIEQRAQAQGVPVDARVSRGRSFRDALEQLLDSEHYDRIIISATDNERTGISARDIQWLLEKAPAEVLILRPAPTDLRRISGAEVGGRL